MRTCRKGVSCGARILDVDAALSSALHSVPPRLSTAADPFAGTVSVRKQCRSVRSTKSIRDLSLFSWPCNDVNVRATERDGRWLHTEVRRLCLGVLQQGAIAA